VDVFGDGTPHDAVMTAGDTDIDDARPILEARWFLDHGRSSADVPSELAVAVHFCGGVATAERQRRFAEWQTSPMAVNRIAAATLVNPHRARVEFEAVSGQSWVLDLRIDPTSNLIDEIEIRRPVDRPDVEIDVVATASIDAQTRAALHAVADASMSDVDHGRLDLSLTELGLAAVARVGERVIGFHLADARRVDLPGLPDQAVKIGGLACVRPGDRRRSLAGSMADAIWSRIRRDGWVSQLEPILLVSRYAHAASWKMATGSPGLVPRPGVAISDWQRGVGRAAAAALGVDAFDDATFVCVGSGRPFGNAELVIEASPAELALFDAVDRTRGDTLLALAWWPAPPNGWGA
jgi:hypothetical protein